MPTPICTLVFLLLYFSSLAAALWWALTTASWAVMVLCSLEPKVTYLSYDTERFLQPCLQVLENKSPLLHTLGWGVPALLTITALVMHQVRLNFLYCCQERKSPPLYLQVEGDELTGVCLLGAQTDTSLLHQLVIPHCIFLASAVIFFVSGLVGSFVSYLLDAGPYQAFSTELILHRCHPLMILDSSWSACHSSLSSTLLLR